MPPLPSHHHSGSTTPWLLLHGFAGSPADFEPLLELLPLHGHLVVVPGHGTVAPASFNQAVGQLQQTLGKLSQPAHLLGYSLGGRLALAAALRDSSKIASLHLLASHPGLEDAEARQKRLAWDENWARQLRQEGLDTFFRAWNRLPLFCGPAALPEGVAAAQAKRRKQLSAEDLAQSIVNFSPGQAPALWTALPSLKAPLSYYVGERDPKYRLVAARLQAALPQTPVHVLPECGHNLLLGATQSLAALLRPFACP